MRSQIGLRSVLTASAAVVALSGTMFAQDAPATRTDEAVAVQTNGGTATGGVTATTTEAETATVTTQAGGTRTTPGTVVETPRREDRPARIDISGGYESDDNDTSYGYFGPSYNRPIGESVALRLALRANHLRYEFDNGEGGRTEVSGPGITPSVGLRFGRRNWVQVSTGLSIRQEERVVNGRSGIVSEEDETKVGLGLGADAWLNTSRRSNLHAMVHYGAVSNYTWARLAGRHQITNFSWRAPVTFYLGAEVVGQGNEDIRSFQAGPLLEMTFGRSQLSFTARGGYKKSTYDVGDDNTGAYFGVGLWKRF